MEGHADVVLTVTNELRHARIVRATVAAAAVLEEFSVERIDDVRLVVDEVFNAMVTGGARTVSFAVTVRSSSLVVAVCGDGATEIDEGYALLGVLGDAVAPGWTLAAADGRVSFDATITAIPH